MDRLHSSEEGRLKLSRRIADEPQRLPRAAVADNAPVKLAAATASISCRRACLAAESRKDDRTPLAGRPASCARSSPSAEDVADPDPMLRQGRTGQLERGRHGRGTDQVKVKFYLRQSVDERIDGLHHPDASKTRPRHRMYLTQECQELGQTAPPPRPGHEARASERSPWPSRPPSSPACGTGPRRATPRR
jgi:hypothetical protein